MIQTLIFDFDGLIVDTETPDYQSWQRVYEEHGCHLPLPLWASFIGRSSAETVFDACAYLEAQIQQTLDHAAVRAVRRGYLTEMIAQQPILPGIESYIAEAKAAGMRVGVASSGTREWVFGNLKRLNLFQCFDVVKCAEDVPRAKPEPDLYLAAIQALDTAPEQALAFEDSPNGVLAAKRAGVRCVAVPNPMTQHFDFGHADMRVSSLGDQSLAQLIARFSLP
jgi:HAD superfamily hydrolase (TIGR01509 family)